MHKIIIASLLACTATPAFAQDDTGPYVGFDVGVTGGFKDQVYEREGWSPTIEYDHEGASIAVTGGYDFGPVRAQVSALGATFARGNAGSPNGNKGFNGEASDPEGGRDDMQALVVRVMPTVDVSLSDKIELSGGLGFNASWLFDNTRYASAEGQGWLGLTDGKARVGPSALIQARYRAGKNTWIVAGVSGDRTGTHTTQRGAESGKVVDERRQSYDLVTGSLGVALEF